MRSSAVSVVAMTFVAGTSAHLSLISIYGSNGVVGHGFGVDTHGRFPRHVGLPGDGGGDCTIFETGTDTPEPPCGRTPELGDLDIPSWLNQAESNGLPAAYANMSIIIEAFQINADGGGPMSCEYNQDATATSWQPMTMRLNQPGKDGNNNVLLTNYTVIADFPPNAICDGGYLKDACIVRCRTGEKKRFGGCFAAKLADSESSLRTIVMNDEAPSQETIPPMNAQRILDVMQREGLLVSPQVNSGPTTDRALSASSAESKQLDAYAQSVVDLMKQKGLFVSSSYGQWRPTLQPRSTRKSVY